MGVVTELAGAIRERRAARTDGEAGLRVLSVLEAASRSLASDGAPTSPVSQVHARTGVLA